MIVNYGGFIKSFLQATLNIQSMFWNGEKGLWLAEQRLHFWESGGGFWLLSCRRVIERPMYSCIWTEAGNPTPLCWLRPGGCSAGAACLISNSWAAFVDLPNFWTLCAAIKILNYLSNLPFNKFIFKCLDWRKITGGTYNSNQKTIFWNSNFFVLFECEQV